MSLKEGTDRILFPPFKEFVHKMPPTIQNAEGKMRLIPPESAATDVCTVFIYWEFGCILSYDVRCARL